MKLPLDPLSEFFILRSLIIDGRVQQMTRTDPRRAAGLDPWEARLIGAQVTDFTYGAVPQIIAEGNDPSSFLRSMRAQVRQDGEREARAGLQ